MEVEEAIRKINVELICLKLQEEANKKAKNDILLKHCSVIGKDLTSI